MSPPFDPAAAEEGAAPGDGGGGPSCGDMVSRDKDHSVQCHLRGESCAPRSSLPQDL